MGTEIPWYSDRCPPWDLGNENCREALADAASAGEQRSCPWGCLNLDSQILCPLFSPDVTTQILGWPGPELSSWTSLIWLIWIFLCRCRWELQCPGDLTQSKPILLAAWENVDHSKHRFLTDLDHKEKCRECEEDGAFTDLLYAQISQQCCFSGLGFLWIGIFLGWDFSGLGFFYCILCPKQLCRVCPSRCLAVCGCTSVTCAAALCEC